MQPAERRLAAAGAAVVGVAFGMARFTFGLTLPALRHDPSLSATGLPDPVLGAIAGGTFAGFLVGIVGAPLLAARRGPRAPTTLGGVCGALGALLVTVAGSPGLLAVGAVLAGSAAGWVWAPYSDLAAALARPAVRPGLVSAISTGTSGGLVLTGVVAILAGDGWRAVWATVALASVAAAVLNLAWVPRVERPAERHRRPLPWAGLALPAGFAVVYQAAVALGFTYAADVARAAGLAADARPVLFVIIGVVGLTGLATGLLAARLGAGRVAAGCLVVLGVSLGLFAVGARSVVLVLLGAAVFAVVYLVGAAVLAVWTAEVAPADPGRALSVAMVVGAVGAIVSPVVVGSLIPVLGLPLLLAVAGGATLVLGVGVALVPGQAR
ncbi:MFS transporter [Actinomycetospora sp. TBRC 11914]|uniref:MFS transporter n=1 Tax=Actinomycetospora sp. TBRC 11914 TaxID=2729387 RepID=UPI00145D4C75|nr:MFS transporter [Actinomycetospora sp. TBRC 11914]NMO93749.1 YbfB/YjiJ family MFS transporter [Actinomycetospora sp. TBRC 11914]